MPEVRHGSNRPLCLLLNLSGSVEALGATMRYSWFGGSTKKSQPGNPLDGTMPSMRLALWICRKLTPRPTNGIKRPFWAILTHHGLNPNGPFINSLHGFHCHRQYCVKTGPDLSPASLSNPYQPIRGFGEGDGTSPWSWNVLYSVIIKFAQQARRDNAARRQLPCGIPWRYQVPINLQSTWARKNDGRTAQTCMVENIVFADDTTLHGVRHSMKLIKPDLAAWMFSRTL